MWMCSWKYGLLLYLWRDWNLRKVAFTLDFSHKGKEGRAGVWQLKMHTLALRGLNFPCTWGADGLEMSGIGSRLLSFLLLFSVWLAVALADDNRLLGMSVSRLFLIWSFFVCVWGDRQFLILKSQTARTASSTISLTCHLQSHSLNFLIFFFLNQASVTWPNNVGRWMLELSTHPPWLLGLF